MLRQCAEKNKSVDVTYYVSKCIAHRKKVTVKEDSFTSARNNNNCKIKKKIMCE